jgi:transcriptional regulator with XRE-family HTH domain
LARPTKTERSPLAETIRQIRTALGETQQAFAARLGQSVVSIAKYETTRARPRLAMLEKLAEIADSAGLKDYALEIKKEYVPALGWTPEERRLFDLHSAFSTLLRTPDSARLKSIEHILFAPKEEPRLSEHLTLGTLASADSSADMQEFRVLLSAIFQDEPRLSMLCGFVWLLIIPGGASEHLRKTLVDRIKHVVLERDEPLIQDELDLLGLLGPEASKAVKEWRERERRLEGLTLPVALKRVREDLGFGIEEFANKIDVSALELEDFERGRKTPDATVLSNILELPVTDVTRSPEGYFIWNVHIRRAFADAVNVSGTLATLENTKASLERMTVAFDLLRRENERLTGKLAESELFGAPSGSEKTGKQQKRERTH